MATLSCRLFSVPLQLIVLTAAILFHVLCAQQWISPSSDFTYQPSFFVVVNQPDGTTPLCASDMPYKDTLVNNGNACAQACVLTPYCDEFNFYSGTNRCQLFVDKPTHFWPPTTTDCIHYQRLNPAYRDCSDVLAGGATKDGVYVVHQGNPLRPMTVYCSQGWTVFQTRTDGLENFNIESSFYTQGFGNWTHEFWMGNEDLYTLLSTPGRTYSIQFNLTDFHNSNKIVQYNKFSIGSSSTNYALSVSGYNTSLSTVAAESWIFNGGNGAKFQAKDSLGSCAWTDNNCASVLGGGWWYTCCSGLVLNGFRIPLGDWENYQALYADGGYSGMLTYFWSYDSSSDSSGFQLSASIIKIRAI